MREPVPAVAALQPGYDLREGRGGGACRTRRPWPALSGAMCGGGSTTEERVSVGVRLAVGLRMKPK
jgi:hypothetical protein